MATNPNDVVKILNEMMKTLEELSDAQLESIEGVFKEQQKILETDKKIKKSQKELNVLKKQNEKKDIQIKKEEQKTLKSKKDLLSSLITTGKTLGKKQFKFSFDKSKNLNDMFSKESFKKLFTNQTKPKTVVENQKKSQSLLNFSRKEDQSDIQEEQLHVLKQIENKIDKLSMAGSGSIFDLLTNGLSGMVGKALGLGSAAVGGATALGGLGKFGKVLGGLSKVGGVALKAAKNPLALGGVAAAGLGYGAYKYLKSDEDNSKDTAIEQRANGGRVRTNSMYLVGENGPELFSPRENGQIIPNHKIQNTKEDKIKSETFNLRPILEEFKDGFKKNLKNLVKKVITSFSTFSKSIGDKLNDWYSSIKEQLKMYVDKLISIPGKVFDKAKDVVGSVFDKVKSLLPGKDKENKSPIVANKNVFNFSADIKKPTLEQYNPFQSFSMPPVKIESKYEIKTIQQNSDLGTDIDKNFWTNTFLPAFSNSIKVRNSVNTDRTLVSSNPFG